MPDEVAARLRDRLPVNPPYEGLVAEGYDTWLPVDDELPEEAAYAELLAEIDGPVLELGCGTGRPLLRWLAAGHAVEGVDASADMLAILRRHATERGLDAVLHRGEIAPLDLAKQYAAIVCPAGTFLLVDDLDRARSALDSYRAHLRPGGVLALTSFAFDGRDSTELAWRVRRTGTVSNGTTIVVHEATHVDDDAGLLVAYNRVERYDRDGVLLDTVLRRQHLRCWRRPDLEHAFEAAGFADVHSVGDERAWVTIGHLA